MLGILEILDKDQVMYFVRSNNLSFKCQRFTPSGFKYIEIRKVEVLTRTRFLCPLSAPCIDYLLSRFQKMLRPITSIRLYITAMLMQHSQ